MAKAKGKMTVLQAVINLLQKKPKKVAKWQEIYAGVSKLVGYEVSPPIVRAVVYREAPPRADEPIFKIEKVENVSGVRLLK